MEQNNSAASMIHMFSYPVFLVKDGIVAHQNHAAERLNIPHNIPITELICTGSDSYQELKDGCLSLTLQLQQTEFLATVMPMGEYNIFHLEDQDPETSRLQAMALAASQLRQPLSDVATSAELLIAGANASQKELSAHLNRGLMQLLRMLGNMNDARDYAHKTYNMEMLDAAAVIRQAVETATALLDDKDQRIIFRDSNCSAITWADHRMLERAVYNLVSNAFKFSPDSSAIHVELKAKGNHIVFQIENSCPNITPELIRSIFFRHHRIPMVEPGEHGIGLGIPLVRAAAAAHGGTLLLDQPDAKSLRFTFTVVKRPAKDATMAARRICIDDTGGQNTCLMELSDILPVSKYEN